MAEESVVEGEDENILYDLLVISEWPPETDVQVTGASFMHTLTLCFDDLLAIKRFRKVCYDQMRAAVRRPKPRSRNTPSHRRFILQRQHCIVFVLKMLLTTTCATKPLNVIFSTILVDFSIRFASLVMLPAARNSRLSST